MILFPLETVVRELPYKMDLSNRLNLGLNEVVVIAPKRVCYYLVKIFGRNIIYFDKGYHEGESEKFYRLVKARKGILVSLDEEGAVDYPDWRTLRNRYSKTLTDYADVVFFWGKRQETFFRNILKPSRARFVLSGHPRFYIVAEDCLPKNHNSKFLLINTNMSFGNNILGLDHVKKNYANRIAKLDELILFDKLKISLIIDFIRAFRSKSDLPILLRPHPEESEEAYNLPIKNYTVSKLGIVNDLIANAYEVVHTDCTTAVESYLLGVKPISLLPSGFENFKTVLPRTISVCFNEYTEAVDYLLKKIINIKSLVFRKHQRRASIGRLKLEQFNIVFEKITKNKKYNGLYKFSNIIVFK